jgi:hypothetical protein
MRQERIEMKIARAFSGEADPVRRGHDERAATDRPRKVSYSGYRDSHGDQERLG